MWISQNLALSGKGIDGRGLIKALFYSMRSSQISVSFVAMEDGELGQVGSPALVMVGSSTTNKMVVLVLPTALDDLDKPTRFFQNTF